MISRRLVLGACAALVLAPVTAFAQDLPDLGGRKVVVVTENAYPPLQFIEPSTGNAIGIINILYHSQSWALSCGH